MQKITSAVKKTVREQPSIFSKAFSFKIVRFSVKFGHKIVRDSHQFMQSKSVFKSILLQNRTSIFKGYFSPNCRRPPGLFFADNFSIPMLSSKVVFTTFWSNFTAIHKDFWKAFSFLSNFTIHSQLWLKTVRDERRIHWLQGQEFEFYNSVQFGLKVYLFQGPITVQVCFKTCLTFQESRIFLLLLYLASILLRRGNNLNSKHSHATNFRSCNCGKRFPEHNSIVVYTE